MKISILPLAIVTAVALDLRNLKVSLEAKSITADVDFIGKDGNVLTTGREIISGADYDAWRRGDDDALQGAFLRKIGATAAAAPTQAPAPEAEPIPAPTAAEDEHE